MVFTWYFLLVADVEVKGDGVFIRLRKEEVVCEDKDSCTRVSSSDVHEPVVEKVVECSGSEVAVSLEAIPEDLIFESGEAFFLEEVDVAVMVRGRRLVLAILSVYLLILC